jgi:hypothetical protein
MFHVKHKLPPTRDEAKKAREARALEEARAIPVTADELREMRALWRLERDKGKADDA